MTVNTVLAKVTSKGSGGRAEVQLGHPNVYENFSDPFLTSRWFTKQEVGDLVVVTIRMTAKRRTVTTCQKAPEPYNKSLINFIVDNGKDLVRQARDHSRNNPSSVTPKSIKKWHLFLKNHSLQDVSGLELPLSESKVREDLVTTISNKPEEVFDGKYAERIFIPKQDNDALEVIYNISQEKPVNVMMVGPSGYGKSSIPKQKAKDWEMSFLRWDCATVRDQEEFFGFRGAENGSTIDSDGKTIFTPSKFTEAITEGNCVVVLDELNRIDPYILNILFPILDHERRTSVAGHDIVVGPNVIFFATINVGFQFTGTFQLDSALVNRFMININVGSLPKKTEQRILCERTGVASAYSEKIVELMTKLRRLNEDGKLLIDASTRVSLQVATLVKHGMTLENAINFGISNKATKDERKEIVDAFRSI